MQRDAASHAGVTPPGVELGVDALERAHELGAARRVARRRRCVPSRCCSSSVGQLGEQPSRRALLGGSSRSSVADARAGRAGAPRRRRRGSATASASADVARPRGRVRQPGELERERRSPAFSGRPLADDVGVALGRHVALLRHLRRRQSHLADLLRQHVTCAERRRQRCAIDRRRRSSTAASSRTARASARARTARQRRSARRPRSPAATSPA